MVKLIVVTISYRDENGQRKEYAARLGMFDLEVMLQEYFVDEGDEE